MNYFREQYDMTMNEIFILTEGNVTVWKRWIKQYDTKRVIATALTPVEEHIQLYTYINYNGQG